MRPASRPVMVVLRSGPGTGSNRGPPLSLNWTMKESKWPSGTVQDRRRESVVGSVTHSSPRRGRAPGLAANTEKGSCIYFFSKTIPDHLPLGLENPRVAQGLMPPQPLSLPSHLLPHLARASPT